MRMPPDKQYQRDPIGWMRDVLGIPEWSIRWSMLPEYRTHRWDGTPDPLAALCEALADGKDAGAESAVGTGKTFLAAGLCLWFFACFEDALVVTTAPKEDQLTLQLWKEIGKHWPKFKARYPMAQTVTLRVRMKEGAGEQEVWAIVGYACGVGSAEDSANRARGFHAAHMLIVVEEFPGVDPAVATAFANTCTGDHNLRLGLGNPDNQFDPLHGFCTEPGVVPIRISALDHPNVVCGRELVVGACGRKSVAFQAQKWGEASPMYGAMVRGISPAQRADALIQLAWCEAAAKRWATREIQPDDLPAFGVDVAQSENGDKAAVAEGRGSKLLHVKSTQCEDATALGTEVAHHAKRIGTEPRAVGVDSVGLGAATVNELRRKFGQIQSLNGGESPIDGAQKTPGGMEQAWMPDANEHRNLRGQMWWQMREDLRLGNVDLPPDYELFRQLTMPTFEKRGKVVWVEEKRETKKRLHRSPDDADAVVYWNWVRPRTVEEKPPNKVPEDQSPGFDYEERKFKPRWNKRPIEEPETSRFTTPRFGGKGAQPDDDD